MMPEQFWKVIANYYRYYSHECFVDAYSLWRVR